MPIIGDGSGVTSFIHLDDAAAAAVLALDHDGPAIYNITDDEPAASEWIPVPESQAGPRPERRLAPSEPQPGRRRPRSRNCGSSNFFKKSF
jgi:nucleoside-diphosphate-sugar epimerase